MKLFLFFLLLALSASALAHDLWLEREGGGLVLYQGHRHSGHAGEEQMSYRPETVQAALCMGDDGSVAPAAFEPSYPVRFADCPALHVRTSSGYWSKTVRGTLNQPKTELSGVLASWLSVETVKRLDRWSPAFARPLSRDLEIAPQQDPFGLRPGDKLRLRVTHQGQPLAGASVAYGGDPRSVTDRDGMANIRLRTGGVQMIAAGFEAPLDDGKADRTIHAATLVFELPAR